MTKKLKIRSSVRPMLLSCTTKTMVIGGTIEEVNGAPWDHDYVAIEPPNVITLDDIEWESSFIPKTPTITAPTVLKQWKIPSSVGDIWRKGSF